MDSRGDFARFNLKQDCKNMKKLTVQFLAYTVLLTSSWLLIIVTGFSVRPIQDDYLALSAISSSSINTYLHSIWETQGGNLFPYAVNAYLLEPLAKQVTFIGNLIFYACTIFAVAAASLMLFSMMTKISIRDFGAKRIVLYITVALVSFEGIFVPSFIGAFSFGTASIAHLWPVLLMTIALYIYENYPRQILLAVLLGLLIGNANAGESLASLIISIVILVRISRNRFRPWSKFVYVLSLTLGLLIGIIFMVAAPGFSNRAQYSVGLPSTFFDLGSRFIKAGLSFPLDSLSHPGAYLAFPLGVLFSSQVLKSVSRVTLKNNLFALFGAYSLFLFSLIGGGTLAYTSWHQALGLQFFLMPLSFFSGVLLASKCEPQLIRHIPKIFLVGVLLFSLLIFRTCSTTLDRATTWDLQLTNNICKLKDGSTTDLLGAELRYPPLQLGIEDIQSWEWMRTSYISWVRGLNEFKTTSCD